MKNKLKGKEYQNDEELARRLSEIKLAGGKEIDWIETLLITIPKPQIEDVHDDLSRETCFYTQAISSILEAHKRFRQLDFPYIRPSDYFAEMVKSDDQMAKIRKNLLERQKRIEDSESRRRERELKKFGKQVQVQKVREKNKKKKENFDAIKKWRKKRQRGGADEKYPIDDEPQREKTSLNKSRYDKPPPNKKRRMKNERFGFGGKPTGNPKSKRNDAKSYAEDVSMFGSPKNKNFKDKRPGQTGGRNFNNRPGQKGGHNFKHNRQKGGRNSKNNRPGQRGGKGSRSR